jgi:hypothetical protein
LSQQTLSLKRAKKGAFLAVEKNSTQDTAVSILALQQTIAKILVILKPVSTHTTRLKLGIS